MSADIEATPSGARVIVVPPPLYYVLGLLTGWLLDRLVALPIGGGTARTVAGAVLCASGLALAAGGVAAVIRHRTTIVPHHAVSALVTTGAFRLSRNPMYAGLAVAYLGVALLLAMWWPLVLWPIVIFAVYRLVIRPRRPIWARGSRRRTAPTGPSAPMALTSGFSGGRST